MEVDKITEGQTIMRQGEFSARSLLQLAGGNGTDADDSLDVSDSKKEADLSLENGKGRASLTRPGFCLNDIIGLDTSPRYL